MRRLAGTMPIITLMFFVTIALSACGSTRGDHARVVRAALPPFFEPVSSGPSDSSRETDLASTDVITLIAPSLSLSSGDKDAEVKCRLKDRIDRKSVFSFRSEDGQKVLAFKMKTSGTEVTQAMVRFTYHFGQAPKDKKAHCRDASPVQGLLPSVYRMLKDDRDQSILEELKKEFVNARD